MEELFESSHLMDNENCLDSSKISEMKKIYGNIPLPV